MHCVLFAWQHVSALEISITLFELAMLCRHARTGVATLMQSLHRWARNLALVHGVPAADHDRVNALNKDSTDERCGDTQVD